MKKLLKLLLIAAVLGAVGYGVEAEMVQRPPREIG